MKKYFITMLLATLVWSCRNGKIQTAEKHSNTSDTLYVEKTINVRDTLITIPADGTTITIPVPKYDTTYFTKSDRASLQLAFRNGQLKADCNCDAWQTLVRLQNEQLKVYQSKTNDQYQKDIQIIKQASKFVKWLAAIGGIFLLLLLILIILKIISIVK